jgi:hypothetical protein
MDNGRSRKTFLFGSAFALLIVSCLAVTAPAGAFTLHNFPTGFCLAVAGGDPNPGAAIIVWTCDGTPSQQWALGDPTSIGSLGMPANTLVSAVAPNRVIGVQGGLEQSGVATPLIAWTEDPPAMFLNNNQGWALVFDNTDFLGHSCFQILNAGVNRQKPFNMGVLGGSTAQGAQVVVWQNPSNGGVPGDQIWCQY